MSERNNRRTELARKSAKRQSLQNVDQEVEVNAMRTSITKTTRMSTMSGGKTMGFRQSNALASIQAFQDQSKNAAHRASVNLGIGGGSGDMNAAELKIENERLQTTLMILNQKMKMQEDNEDLSDKWKSQVQSKDAQITIMNDQVGSLQQENEKQRRKMKDLSSEVASFESQLQNLQASKKQLMVQYDDCEEERQQTKSNYNKLYSQFNQLQSQNDFNLREIEELREQINEHEADKMELRENVSELTSEVGMLNGNIGQLKSEVSHLNGVNSSLKAEVS